MRIARETLIIGVAAFGLGYLLGQWVDSDAGHRVSEAWDPLGVTSPPDPGGGLWSGDMNPHDMLSRLEAGLAADSSNHTMLTDAAHLALEVGEVSKARDYYERAIIMDTPTVERLIGLSRSWTLSRRYREGENILLGALRLFPDEPRIWYHLGLVRMHENDLDGAADAWERFVELAPENPRAGDIAGTIARIRRGEVSR